MQKLTILLLIFPQNWAILEHTIRKECDILETGCEALAEIEWALAKGVGGINDEEITLVEEDLFWGKKVLYSAREKTQQLEDLILQVSFYIF